MQRRTNLLSTFSRGMKGSQHYRTVSPSYRLGVGSMLSVSYHTSVPNDLDAAISMAALNERQADQERWLAKVKQEPRQITNVPIDLLTQEMCDEVVALNHYFIKEIPKKYQTSEMWLEVVKKAQVQISNVPLDLLTQEMCNVAVSVYAHFIKYIPQKYQTDQMWIKAVKEDPYQLKDMPEQLKTYELCMDAVKKAAFSSQYVPQHFQTQEMWHAMFEQSASYIDQMPDQFKNSKIVMSAILQDSSYIQYVPEELRTKDAWIACITGDPSFLAQLSEQYKTQEMYNELINRNPTALSYVPDALKTKEMWLTALKYSVIKLGDVPYKFRLAAWQMLENVKYLVVTADEIFPVKHEAGLSAYTYANARKRKDCVICVEEADLGGVLDLLKRKGATEVNLVLADHTADRSEAISRLRVNDIGEVLTRYKNITKITLLGCYTAKSKKLDAEIMMVKEFQEKINSKNENPCGLILLSTSPATNDYADLLNKVKLERTFVVIKTVEDKKVSYSMLYLERKSADKIDSVCIDMKEADAYAVHSRLTSGKTMAFPKNSKDKYILRHQKSPLSSAEFEALENAKTGAIRFTKAHPEYKSDKKAYPFLFNFYIKENEVDKISNSLMKHVIIRIESRSDIQRPITVKGYTKPIHVDQQEQRIIASEGDMYSYKNFNLFTDAIDRRKLAESRKDAVNQMKKAVIKDDETDAKSISYVVQPRKYD